MRSLSGKSKKSKKKEKIMRLRLPLDEEQGYTIPELLQDYLLRNPEVEFAGYRIRHPLTPVPTIFVRSKDPQKALSEALSQIETDLSAFKKAFEEAVKSYKAKKRKRRT